MNIFCAARLLPQIMEEARLVANLKHRNILSMIGVSQAEHIVLMMEFQHSVEHSYTDMSVFHVRIAR